MTARPLRLSAPWAAVLEPVLRSPELQALAAHLRKRKAAGIPVYPPGKDIFAALDAAPPEQVRVVIVGQDPYHGPGQAPWPGLLRGPRGSRAAVPTEHL